ncbi:Kunitz trypsin inhibitor [Quillaja saponaria]|uniref:Kunitz trypsin inhibitor n=1 Tax=Quillaja saponaria TaxID=32244 RepID=A0AAD7PU94_QUISA|nr:Kunitz trypsin inhibitor [Quillaja saponaria]
MKTAFLALFVFLFAFTTKPFLTAAIAAPEPVLDVFHEQLRSGVNYYIVPSTGGLLSMVSTRNKTCPLDVIQASNHIQPLTFTPYINPKKGVVRVSTDLNIKFSDATSCVQPAVWKLDYFDRLTGQFFVTTGGVVGNPGPQTIKNWFKIEQFGRGYKLVYCPTVCKFCRVQCKDLGIYTEEGMKRLALSDEPLLVRFLKAHY